MIILPNHKLAFIHIPKCGGTSIRTQITKIDSDHLSFGEVEDHAGMGLVDMGHIQLSRLEKHMPDTYRQVLEAEAFSVVRDPLTRFGSSLRQTIWRYEQKPMTLIEPNVLKEKTRSIIAEVTKEIDSPSHQFIFFARQKDFVFNGNEQVVKAVYPLENLADLLGTIATKTSTKINEDARSNQNVDLKVKSLGNLAYKTNDVLRRLLPDSLHAPIKNTATKLLAKKGSAAESTGLLDMPEVKEFVAEFYAEDNEIYQQSLYKQAEFQTGRETGKLVLSEFSL